MGDLDSSGYFQVERLLDRLNWGVAISALNIADLSQSAVRQRLYDIWIQEGVIVFRGMDDADSQLALSRVFGPLREHPAAREAISAQSRELIDVKYVPEGGWISLVNGERRGQWLPWHSDLIYVDKINHGGILRPIKLPSRLGETGFIDKISAYDALSEELKQRIEGLHVAYQYDMDLSQIKFGPDRGGKVLQYSAQAAGVQSRLHEYPTVIHPMVFKQPETGRKVLNVSPWFAQGIYEMRNAEGDELLEAITQHIAAPNRAYYHRWKMGEMVLWDNWRMLHSSTGSPLDEERYLQRTTIGGDYGLGKIEPGTGANADTLNYVHV